jgi:hypothetical protein
LNNIKVALQYSNNVDQRGGGWSTLREWPLGGQNPDFSANAWETLSAQVPAQGENNRATSFRWMQTGSRPNAPIYWAIDNVRVINQGGPVNVAVEVDGTRSEAAPTGLDFEGKPAPNAVRVTYEADGLDDTGRCITQVRLPADASPTWTGNEQRHMICSREFTASRGGSLEDCAARCDASPTCTMFSYGYTGADLTETYNDNNKDTWRKQGKECRVSTGTTPQGCYPEPYAGARRMAPQSMPDGVPVFMHKALPNTAEPMHGAFASRTASHMAYPTVGGVVGKVLGASDLSLGKSGNEVSVQLGSPALMQKVVVRQPVGVDKDCLASEVAVTFGDGTITKVSIAPETEQSSRLHLNYGDAGGAYASAEVKGMFGPPVVDSYSLKVSKTAGECKAPEGALLRGFEARGIVLRNIALKGNGLDTCTTNAPLGAYENDRGAEYNCEHAFDGGSEGAGDAGHSWVTDGLGEGAFVTVKFDKKRTVQALAVRQNEFHRVKKVKLSYAEPGNADTTHTLQNTIEPQMLALAGAGGRDTAEITLTVLSTWDKYQIPALAKKGWRLDEQFKTAQFDKSVWNVPSLRGEAISYGLDMQRGQAPFYFEGNQMGKKPLRSKLRFPVSHTEINVGLVRGDACSNHFIALSPDPNYKFSFGTEANVVKFAYNCDHKVIYGNLPKGMKEENVQNRLDYVADKECAFEASMADRINMWKILVTPTRLEFTGECGTMVLNLKKSLLETFTGGQFYLNFGASFDTAGSRAYFDSIKVRSWGTGLRDLGFLGR